MSAEPEHLVTLSPTQAGWLLDRSPICGLVGGVGAGKTRIALHKLLWLLDVNRGCRDAGALVGLDYPWVTRVLIPEMAALFIDELDIDYRVDERRWLLELEYEGVEHIVPILQTRRHASLAGANWCFAVVDEAGVQPKKAISEIRKRIRRRDAVLRQFAAVGAPDSGRSGWFYETFDNGGEPLPGSVLYRMPTTENPHLADDYVAVHLSHLDAQEQDAYVRGLFVSMSGLVYTHWNTGKHAGRVPFSTAGDLVMGCDFGVGCMAWILGVVDHADNLHVFDELVAEGVDTIEMTRRAVARWAQHLGFGHDIGGAAAHVKVYCDPAGGPEHKHSSSDVRILQGAGFAVFHHHQHPRVRDRVNAVQERLRFNKIVVDEGCSYLIKCMAGHDYDPDKGGPRKGRPRDGKKGLDHGADALGYLVEYLWPCELIPMRQHRFH